MASDNGASYGKIGFTVIIAVVAIVATLVYIGGMRGHGDEILAETYYNKPVGGLSVGSAVNFRGVRIGEVREISFVGNKYDVDGYDNQRIYIKLALSRSLFGFAASEDGPPDIVLGQLVKYGLRATVASNGITGLSRIEFDMSENEAPPERISWKPRHIYIPAKMSLMDSFSVAATKVMNQINTMEIGAVWSNIHHSVEALAQATDSAKTMMDSRQADVEKLIGDLTESVSAVRAITTEVRQNPSLLIRERVPKALPETRR